MQLFKIKNYIVVVQSLSCVWLFACHGLPVLHYLLEFAETYVHRIPDVIQPFSSSVAPFSFCSQSLPQSFPVNWLFTSGGQTMEFQLLHQSFQWKLYSISLTEIMYILQCLITGWRVTCPWMLSIGHVVASARSTVLLVSMNFLVSLI